MTVTGPAAAPPAEIVSAVLRRIHAWTRLARAFEPELVARLHDRGEVAELLAGAGSDAVVRPPHDRAAADLFVFLDQLALHGGRRLTVTPLGDRAYRLSDASPVGTVPLRSLVHDLTDQVTAGRPLPYPSWPGRVDRIAVITHDRPDTLAGCLDVWDDNLRRFGRSHVEVVVYDDSGPALRPRVRSVVAGAAAAGLRVRYVGPGEKQAIRAAFERGFSDGCAEQPVLDRLLGAVRADGTWAGSAAEQRNWAILSAAGRRVLVCDDDVRPAVLDASLAVARTAAQSVVRDAARLVVGRPLAAGRLLTTELAGRLGERAVRPWPTDLPGILEETEPTLVSAGYTGHPDRRSALLLERFFLATERSIDVCDTGPPSRHVRQAGVTGGPRKFRGGAFVTSGTGEGIEFAVRRGRNEDFALAISLAVSTGGRLRARESGAAFLLHERGPRHCGPFVAHRQEREGDLVNRLIEELGRRYAEAFPGRFDPESFTRYGLQRVDESVERAAARLADDIFQDGLAYRRRALAHLRFLSTIESRIASAAPGRAMSRLRGRWYADRATPPAALLHTAARTLRERRPLPAPVLAACVQVLVPAGIIPFMDVRSMRRRLRSLSGEERAEAVATLEREAGWAAGEAWAGLASTAPVELTRRVAAKAARTRQLISEIDVELGYGSIPSPGAWGELPLREPRARFAEGVRSRVGDEVRLFLRAVPYAYRLRSVLPILDRAAGGVRDGGLLDRAAGRARGGGA